MEGEKKHTKRPFPPPRRKGTTGRLVESPIHLIPKLVNANSPHLQFLFTTVVFERGGMGFCFVSSVQAMEATENSDNDNGENV